MTKWRFINKFRFSCSFAAAVILVFYAFNFVPRNVEIIASRSFPRQILDYVLNFWLFFAIIYLIFSLLAFIYQKFR